MTHWVLVAGYFALVVYLSFHRVEVHNTPLGPVVILPPTAAK